MVDRIRKIFSTINIETLLKQAETDFSNENPFLFCKKVKLASEERESAESIIIIIYT